MRLTTKKDIPEMKLDGKGNSPALVAAEVLRTVEGVERRYQEELNRGFTALSEGEFKGLRRQLPVTRQKVEWEKVGGYRVSLSLTNFSAQCTFVRLLDCSWLELVARRTVIGKCVADLFVCCSLGRTLVEEGLGSLEDCDVIICTR